jgi:uncharacterized protein (DUF433 family)
MPVLDHITRRPDVMGGKICLRSAQVTVGSVAELVASGRSIAEIQAEYPYLEEEDVRHAVACAISPSDVLRLPIRKSSSTPKPTDS